MSTENYSTPDDDQKYGRKRLGRKYGTIPFYLDPYTRRITRSLEKITLKTINTHCSIVFNKTCLNIYIYIYIYIYRTIVSRSRK